MKVNNNNQKYINWNAKWLWQDEDGPANTWICFRKNFDMEELPSSVLARIAVDSKYWLWINGKLAVFEGGLKRGPTPEDSYYDEVDIGHHLKNGQNTIAILVWYWGKHGFAHRDSGKGGLLFECSINERNIISDDTWKTKVHPSYERVTDDPNPNFRLAEHNICFDARKDVISGWEQPGFVDFDWETPVEKGFPPAAPWNNLWKRPIPQWKDLGMVNYASRYDLPGTGVYTTVTAKLPYNAQITPYLKVAAPAGLKIVMRTDNYCGGGNDTDYNLRAEYITKDGIQEYESLGWMNGHEVHYIIPEGVKILDLKYRETGYNTSFAGSFKCNDDFYNVLWEKAKRTLYVTMRDNYMDCPDRERAQWWGDAVIEIGETFYALDTDAYALAKKAISNLTKWQRADHTLYSPAPDGNWNMELPQQSLASIGMYGFWTYYMYTGDSDTIVRAYGSVKKYLDIWTLDADGLVIHRTGEWDWCDWGEDTDVEVLDNAWYYLALKAAVKMAGLTGNSGDIPGYEHRMKSIEDNFDRVFWNGNEYRSPGYSGDTDDRANGLAVAAGLVACTNWPYIRKVLGEHMNASPYMEKYVLEALYIMGYEQDAMDRMKTRYNSMVNDESCSTLWEQWFKGGWSTCNHAWTGGPLTLLCRYAAGVAPESPEYGTYHVFPQEGELSSISLVVPSVKGNINVNIKKESCRYLLELISPRGTEAVVGIPRKAVDISEGSAGLITVNEIKLWENGRYNGNVPGISYVGKDERYYMFKAIPGFWQFAAIKL